MKLSRLVLGVWFCSQIAIAGLADKPNIIIIYADDMGYGDLAIQNPDSKFPTPNLDRLAQEGIRFTDAHSTASICTPSRYSLLTGIYYWRKFTGIVNNFEPSVFDAEEFTLPEMLQDLGYYTACIGKWHLGWDWYANLKPGYEIKEGGRADYPATAFDWSKPVPDGPVAHGFDYYFGDDVPNFPPYTWIENDRILIEPTIPYAPDPIPPEGNHEGRPGPMVEGWRLDAVMPKLEEKTVEFIHSRKDQDEPFFLYFSWTSPHAPIVPSEEYLGTTEVGPYGDFMYQSDATVGAVLDALEASGLAENTLIIFSSDNGPEHYAFDRIINHDHRSMGPLKGIKQDIWEGGHRVPMIMHWPGTIQAGRVSDVLISQLDIMPTLASLLGYDLPEHAATDSYDLSSIIKADVPKYQHRQTHVHEAWGRAYALRHQNWLLVDAPSGLIHRRTPQWFRTANNYQENPLEVELFNLKEDAEQRYNLASKYPEKVRRLQEKLYAIREQGS